MAAVIATEKEAASALATADWSGGEVSQKAPNLNFGIVVYPHNSLKNETIRTVDELTLRNHVA